MLITFLRGKEFIIPGISIIVLSILFILSELNISDTLRTSLFPVLFIAAIALIISSGYVFLKVLFKKQ